MVKDRTLLGLLKDVDIDKAEDILSRISKYDKVLARIESILGRLDRMGITNAIIRAIGKKTNIPNISEPIINPLSIVATSPTHLLFYKEMNHQSEETVHQILINALKETAVQEANKEK